MTQSPPEPGPKPLALRLKGDAHGRSFAKGVTWRVVGTADTFLWSWLITHQPVAAGTIEPVRIVAFDLGTCNGRYMYAAVEWYFPQHGQKFDPSQFEDVCIGAYYPLQTGQYLWAVVPGALIALLGAAFALLNYAFDEIGNPALRPLRRRRRGPREARRG